MTRTGDDAKKFMDDALAEARGKAGARLAEAKASSPGKEAFDLAKLDALVDTGATDEGRTGDDRRRHYEEMYYLSYGNVKTLAEFADKLRDAARWA